MRQDADSHKEETGTFRTQVVSEIVLISDATLQLTSRAVVPNAYTELRYAAARYGADALLIVNDASSVDRYNNPAAFLCGPLSEPTVRTRNQNYGHIRSGDAPYLRRCPYLK